MVNIDFPERNREFEIQFVNNMKKGKFERHGFHIRMPVAALDYNKFSVTVPEFGAYSLEFKRRLLAVKGPSQNAWYKDYKLYHQTNACASTLKAHKKTTINIGKDFERQLTHWLLVFPPPISLSNQVFSDDEGTVPVSKNSLVILAADNISKKDLRQVVLFWKIAVNGGEQVDTDDEGSDADQLFAS